MISRKSTVLMLGCALLASTAALAQWSTDPQLNLAVAAKADDQVQPKVGTLPDGSAFVSWFDNDSTGNPPGGYDVFLQFLDGTGVAQWDPKGIRIADRGYSSTTDYGFAVDAGGNALLAFNDDRSGTDQITVTKVSSAGTQLWGPNGVQVSSGTDSKFAPDVVATSDGGVAVAWSGSGKKGVDAVFVAKLDSTGAIQWDLSLASAKGFTYASSHIAAGEDGSVIVLMVRTEVKNIGTGNRGLLAQKYSSKGRPMWSKGVVVLDNASLQGGEFPAIVSDGAGGAVTAWYTTGGESFVQRLNASGVESYPHNGLAAATNGNARTEPSVAFDASSGDITIVYNESSADGNGVGGQRFSPTGQRLWTSDGVNIRPFDFSVSTSWPTVLNTPSGPLVTWIEQTSYPDSQIYGARLNVSGAFTCKGIAVSLAANSKNRIAAVPTPEGGGIFAWEDGRNGLDLDIYAQRVTADCGLGLVP